MARRGIATRRIRARLPLFWLSLIVWVLFLPMLVIADRQEGPGWAVVANIVAALVGAQSVVVVGSLAFGLWGVRELRQSDREWVTTTALTTLDLHATVRERLASVADETYRLVRPILQPMDRVSSEALRADLNRPPALLKTIGTPEADAYVAQLRRSADGPLETARDQAMSIAASIGLRSRAEPLDWASGRRARIETRPGDWERLRLAAIMVDRLIGDLVDPQLAKLHARMTHHVAERIDREISDDRETRKRFKLSQPDPVTIEAKRRRAHENPFLRFRRDSRVLAHTVELVVLEASGAAWALGELDDLKAVEPDEHDRKVLELVGQVLDRVRTLHYQLREQTVVVREIAELHTPVDQLAAVLQQVSASAEQVHYQAIDRLWELDRDRIGKPRRFHRPSKL
jgi:hypothetical protein